MNKLSEYTYFYIKKNIFIHFQNVSRLVIGHLNTNSLPGKFNQLKLIIENNIDILIITGTRFEFF